jgi:RNA polymerase-binding protein DksA
VAKLTKKTSKATTASKSKSAAAARSRPGARPAARPASTKPAAKTAPSRPEVKRINGKASSGPKVGSLPGVNAAAGPASHPAAPPANAKPGKNQAGLKQKELDYFRDLLLAKRRELLGDVASMEEEALRSTSGSNLSNLPIHMADMGSDNYEQEFTLRLVDKDRQLLREINHALAKIRDGSYGICEGTGKPIGKARLEVKPWARHSIEYTRQMESGLIRR